jgi:hypothetical protein
MRAGWRGIEPGSEDCARNDQRRVLDETIQVYSSLVSNGPPRTREAEQQRASERGKKRDERMRAKVLASLKQDAV